MNQRAIDIADTEQESILKAVDWVAWQTHTRTENIAAYFHIPVKIIQSDACGVVRYIRAILGTIKYIYRRKPKALIVQNPSLVLTLLATLIRPLFGFHLIVDAHNEAVQPFINTHPVILGITRWLLKKADLTIVTNEALASLVRAEGGNPFILPDRVPDVNVANKGNSGRKLKAVLISTFARDEPIAKFLEAAAKYKNELDLFVTGNVKGDSVVLMRKYTDSATFTGYLPEEEYWNLLASSDFIADLSLMENCLVCGAYESVALSKPVILSDNAATRQLFRKGAVYVDNSVEGISSGINEIIERLHYLEKEVVDLKVEMRSNWDLQATELKSDIKRLSL